jgi:hypothetical protein
MKYNFTKSGVPMPKKGYSQQYKSDKDIKILEFLKEIVSVIGLFFKQKNSQKDIDLPQSQKGIDSFPKDKLFNVSSLQEYFFDKFPPQLSIKNVKSMSDLIPNSDLIMNKLSLKSNSTVKEYNLGSQFDEKLKRWIPSFSFPKKIYSGDDDYP